jgi:plasmid stability protein
MARWCSVPPKESHHQVLGQALSGRTKGIPKVIGLYLALTELECYHDSLAQIIVRNLEDDVRDKLRERAKRHGRSMGEEVREILRSVVLPETKDDSEVGLGTRIARRFADCQLDEPLELPPREEARGVDFSE